MRVDPETGALDAGRWAIDPREPQSSFVQWARAAGFDHRYAAEVGDWLVLVQWGVGGVLRRIRLNGPDHERWAEAQRPPPGVEVIAEYDKHYSDAHVGITYPPTTTDGPPPEPGDLGLVAHAARLDLHPVGRDWELTPEYLAFERLCRRPPPEDALAEVVRTGTAAGRCYAAHLVPAAWSALVDDTSPLSVADAPLTTVADYARHRV